MPTRAELDALFPPFDGKIWEPAREWMEDSRREVLKRLREKVSNAG